MLVHSMRSATNSLRNKVNTQKTGLQANTKIKKNTRTWPQLSNIYFPITIMNAQRHISGDSTILLEGNSFRLLQIARNLSKKY
jgi:hypothetical protein